MPTCTQITDALNVLASATTNPNVITDLSSDIAVLTVPFAAAGIAQLTTGGDAILSPLTSSDVEGKQLKVTISGRAHLPNILGNGMTLNIVLGSTSVASHPFDAHLGLEQIFTTSIFGSWDSTAQTFLFWNQSSVEPSNQGIPVSVPTQSDLAFTIQAGQFSGSSSNNNTLTITQFDLKFA